MKVREGKLNSVLAASKAHKKAWRMLVLFQRQEAAPLGQGPA